VIVLGLDPNPSTSQGGPHRRHTLQQSDSSTRIRSRSTGRRGHYAGRAVDGDRAAERRGQGQDRQRPSGRSPIVWDGARGLAPACNGPVAQRLEPVRILPGPPRTLPYREIPGDGQEAGKWRALRPRFGLRGHRSRSEGDFARFVSGPRNPVWLPLVGVDTGGVGPAALAEEGVSASALFIVGS
jgi:hypothetical protein